MNPQIAFQTNEQKYQIVRNAILNKKPIAATYDRRERLLCPHALGLGKEHTPMCLSYQFGGASSRPLGPDGSPKNWRCMAVNEMIDVRIILGAWHTAPGHSREQTCVKSIDVEVS